MFRPTCRALFVFALLAAAAPCARAQRDTDTSLPNTSFEIAGQVRTADGRSAVADTLVRLENFGGGLIEQSATDGTGRFRFAGLRPGQYVVSVKTEGFAASSQQLDISRLIPRQYVLLQLRPEAETFRRDGVARDGSRIGPSVVDASVPEPARREFERGRAALEDKRAADAARHLEKATALDPEFFDAHLLLGQARMELKEWDGAAHSFQRAAEVRKTSAALIYLGEALRRQKKYAEAEHALVEALKLDRGSWQGHFTLGRVYWEAGEVVKAAPHVGQSLKINPDYAEGHLLAGNIFMRLSMPEHALVEYEEYLRLAPGGEFAKQTAENVKKLKKALPEKK
jgi:tetratricopeptide (TPR) repeat protein